MKRRVPRAFARCFNLPDESPDQIVAGGRTLRAVVKNGIHSLYPVWALKILALVWLTATGKLEAKRVLGERSIVDPSIADRIRRDLRKSAANQVRAEAMKEEEAHLRKEKKEARLRKKEEARLRKEKNEAVSEKWAVVGLINGPDRRASRHP
jgi:hypothetical protein